MSDLRGREMPLSTFWALLFAGLSIAIFHGFNAYVFWANRRAC
jgi:hypothetical protein